MYINSGVTTGRRIDHTTLRDPIIYGVPEVTRISKTVCKYRAGYMTQQKRIVAGASSPEILHQLILILHAIRTCSFDISALYETATALFVSLL